MQNLPSIIPPADRVRFRGGATTIQHGAFDIAFKFFNIHLFDNALPDCLITMQRKAKTNGYFLRRRFGWRDGSDIVDEIALNPTTFSRRTDEAILSTLVHEMAHCWQCHFGRPQKSGAPRVRNYHDAEWAEKMEEIGLIPSHTGRSGGRRTGAKMTHYIATGGRFQQACDRLLATGYHIAYVETGPTIETGADGAVAKTADGAERVAREPVKSKVAFTCPCCNAKAWGKPSLKIRCDACDQRMAA